MTTTYQNYRNSGIILIETLLVLPIFISIVLLVIFVGTSYNARTSLTVAVGNVRQAFTRGDAYLVGSEVIPEIQKWTSSPTGILLDDSLLKLISTSTESSGAIAVYNRWIEREFGSGVILQDLPARYIYALAFTLQSMVQSVGPALRAPCDPAATDGSGAGCLKCVPLNACRELSNIWPPQKAPLDEPECDLFDLSYDTNWIGIECVYRPDNSVLEPIVRLTSWVAGNQSTANIVTFTRRAFFKD